MTHLPSLSELTPYYNRQDLIEKVVAQLAKDFNWFNLTVTFTGKDLTPYQELFNQILPLVDEMLNDDYKCISKSLYLIYIILLSIT